MSVVLWKSARRAVESLQSEEFASVRQEVNKVGHFWFREDHDDVSKIMGALKPAVAKYAPALELLIYEHVDVAGALQDVHACSLYGESCRVVRLELGSRGAQECERFAASDRHEENGGMLGPMHLVVRLILGRFLDFSGDEPAEPCDFTIVFQE